MPEQTLINQSVTYPDSKPNELDMDEGDLDTAPGQNHFAGDLIGHENMDAEMSCIDAEDKDEERKQEK